MAVPFPDSTGTENRGRLPNLQHRWTDDEANSFTQSMLQRRIQDRDEAAESSRTVAMVNSLKRFRQIMFVGGDNQSAAAILEICKFTREASDVCINPVRTCD